MHRNRNKSAIKDIRISNDMQWQRQHWRSLCAAYQRSAFFEFYQDELVTYYEKKYEFLFDYNLELLQFILSQLHITTKVESTSAYQDPSEILIDDYRAECDTGEPGVPGNESSYPQVFSYKNNFTGGLSVVDLLFSMGPRSVEYL